MIFPNNNKHIIKKLCRGSLNNNKSRNIIIVIAIALTTILFSTLFTVSLGVFKTIENQTMRQFGTSAHASLNNLTEDEFNKLKSSSIIDKLGYSKLISIPENEALSKRPSELRYGTKDFVNKLSLDKNNSFGSICADIMFKNSFNNGTGLLEEEINTIFKRFYRGENSQNEEGVGLGLYLAREIITKQNGYIKVNSIKGSGTCFSIFLPI